MKLTIALIFIALLAVLEFATNTSQGAIYFIAVVPAIIGFSYFIDNKEYASTEDIIAANAVDVNSPEFEAAFREKYKLGAKDTRTDEQYLADLRKHYDVDN